jgi:hypothetical protein
MNSTPDRAHVVLAAAGRFPEKTVLLNVERTAFFRGVAVCLGCNTVQEAFDRYATMPYRQIGTIV